MSEKALQHGVLGRETAAPECYSPQVLFRVARSENRARYRINDQILPFWGCDVWKCYEFSCLTDGGLPVQQILKLTVPCESRYMVESKSLKLYLFSFNFEKMGKTPADCVARAASTISADLERLLESTVEVSMFDCEALCATPFVREKFDDLLSLIPQNDLQKTFFQTFTETPDLLGGQRCATLQRYRLRTSVLRSNCPVTSQPDWGDLFVFIEARWRIDLLGFLQYIVSFRSENHFHEEVVEMIFKRLTDRFTPARLMVAAMYTRRGGIDINPIRTSHKSLIDKAFLSKNSLLSKTGRQ